MRETTRIVTDERSLLHTVPPGFPECPERLTLAIPSIQAGGRSVETVTRSSTLRKRARKAAFQVHDAAYIARFEGAVADGAALLDGSDNPISSGTAEAAWSAVEVALIVGADLLAQRHALALTRPPGHHCERDRAMGFCFLNQVAILAEQLISDGYAERVAIVDFDVHHGNGTQHLFEERADVFYASCHQFPFYPGTGAAAERGIGAGEGATLNVPLPAGTGNDVYGAVLRDEIVPAVDEFRPDVLLASAGFDAWREDPLGGMALDHTGFAEIGARLAELAWDRCDGRFGSILEGGYDLGRLGSLIDAYLSGLEGRAIRDVPGA